MAKIRNITDRNERKAVRKGLISVTNIPISRQVKKEIAAAKRAMLKAKNAELLAKIAKEKAEKAINKANKSITKAKAAARTVEKAKKDLTERKKVSPQQINMLGRVKKSDQQNAFLNTGQKKFYQRVKGYLNKSNKNNATLCKVFLEITDQSYYEKQTEPILTNELIAIMSKEFRECRKSLKDEGKFMTFLKHIAKRKEVKYRAVVALFGKAHIETIRSYKAYLKATLHEDVKFFSVNNLLLDACIEHSGEEKILRKRTPTKKAMTKRIFPAKITAGYTEVYVKNVVVTPRHFSYNENVYKFEL